jgi:hypothetical protein
MARCRRASREDGDDRDVVDVAGDDAPAREHCIIETRRDDDDRHGRRMRAATAPLSLPARG